MFMPLMIDMKKAVIFGAERGEGLQKVEKLSFYADQLVLVPEKLPAPREIIFEKGPAKYTGEKFFHERKKIYAVVQEAVSENNIDELIEGASFVTSDLEDRGKNELIYELCKEKNILCNVIDTKDLCNSWFMSHIDTSTMLTAISTKGSVAFYAAQTRRELQREMEYREKVASILSSFRENHTEPGNRFKPIKALYEDRAFQRLIKKQKWQQAETYLTYFAESYKKSMRGRKRTNG